MTYPLGTQLIFTELAEAAAAARLFCGGNMQTLLPAELLGLSKDSGPQWEYGFDYRDGLKWRIVINTPEKQRWFEPQEGDLLKVFFESAAGVPDGCNGMLQPELMFFQGQWTDSYFDRLGLEFYKFLIAQRNNKPFPQPQEVIAP